jgi:hypothetical protein
MAKYIVNVCRIAYGNLDIEVEADSPYQAEERALNEAGNHLFGEHSSEYEAMSVSESQPSN